MNTGIVPGNQLAVVPDFFRLFDCHERSLQRIELKGGAGHVTNYVQLYPTSWDAKQAFQDGKRWADDKNRQLRLLLTAKRSSEAGNGATGAGK
jgi:hypothetical protein